MNAVEQNSQNLQIDLDAYFQRIGYRGDRTPTLKTLQAIHLLHPQAIPFENLNPLLQQPVHLNLEALQQKLIHEGRGGYCFEQNLLLRSVLLTLGFHVTNLAARVMWNAPADRPTSRSHMLMRVEIEDQPYIVDVGFGGITLTAPLRLQPDLEQQTPHEPFRLIETNQTYFLQANLNQTWKPLYRFDLQEQVLPDYEVSNWYVSTHPSSLFTNHLMVAIATPNKRYALRNHELTIHPLGGETEHRTLTTVAELRTILQDVFRITLPAIAHLDRTLERLINPPVNAAERTA